MDVEALQDFGLTDSEISVYLALLKLGSSRAGKVIDSSGLQNPVVHRAFHSLIEKGLATYSIEGKIKYYQAVEPKVLLSLFDERRDRLAKFIPELESLKRFQVSKARATVYEGIRGVRELFYLMLETDSKELFAYGGPQKSLELLGDFFWRSFHKRREERGIEAKMIFHTSLKHRVKVMKEYALTEVRVTEKDFEGSAETVICGSKVAIIIYLDNPIGVLIDEKMAAKSYSEFFKLLWVQAKKI